MSRIFSIVGVLTICGVTLLSGWVHSAVVSQQHVDESLKIVGDQLSSMPQTSVGPWLFSSDDELPKKAAGMLELSGYLLRTYRHETQGWQIQVFVGVGPQGPISVHTPDVCYPANDFEITSNARPMNVTDSSGGKHSLWSMELKSRDSEEQRLRSVYAWSRAGTWTAAKHPRFAFMGAPLLYKIQLAAPQDPDAKGSVNPTKEFLTEFLPAFHQHMQF